MTEGASSRVSWRLSRSEWIPVDGLMNRFYPTLMCRMRDLVELVGLEPTTSSLRTMGPAVAI
jgi:hypothetical protein